jgi:hypothetical protein
MIILDIVETRTTTLVLKLMILSEYLLAEHKD